MIADLLIRVSRSVVALGLAVGVLFAPASGSARTVHCSIDEFVAAQGTFCNRDGRAAGALQNSSSLRADVPHASHRAQS